MTYTNEFCDYEKRAKASLDKDFTTLANGIKLWIQDEEQRDLTINKLSQVYDECTASLERHKKQCGASAKHWAKIADVIVNKDGDYTKNPNPNEFRANMDQYECRATDLEGNCYWFKKEPYTNPKT